MPTFEILFRFPETDLSSNDVNTIETWDIFLFVEFARVQGKTITNKVFHLDAKVVNDDMELCLIEDGENSNAVGFCDAIGDDDQLYLETIERELVRAAAEKWDGLEFSEKFTYEYEQPK